MTDAQNPKHSIGIDTPSRLQFAIRNPQLANGLLQACPNSQFEIRNWQMDYSKPCPNSQFEIRNWQ